MAGRVDHPMAKAFEKAVADKMVAGGGRTAPAGTKQGGASPFPKLSHRNESKSKPGKFPKLGHGARVKAMRGASR